MASPQLQNGYTRISNEILEHLAYPGISGSGHRLLNVVLRKTYGFGKKKDYISLSQFQKGTRMGRKQVIETIKELVGKHTLLKEKSAYGINKNWEEWVVGKRPPLVGKHPLPSGQTPTKGSGQTPTYKRKKETNTKETIAAKTPLGSFSLQEEIKKLEENSRRDMNIIALYLEQRKPDIRTHEQFQTTLKRHLRPAKSLSPFSDNQILKAVAHAKDKYPEWTIETLVKLVTK